MENCMENFSKIQINNKTYWYYNLPIQISSLITTKNITRRQTQLIYSLLYGIGVWLHNHDSLCHMTVNIRSACKIIQKNGSPTSISTSSLERG